jgi:DNA-binding NtrC family response regulator
VSLPAKLFNVFVVDDEYLIASTLAVILRHKGFDARSFTAPLEALQAARSDTPDLLLSDVIMSAMSGIDLAIQVQKQCPDCRVLLFSGQAATVDLLKAARADGHDFDLLPKPAHPTDLLRAIQEALATRRRTTQSMAPSAERARDPLPLIVDPLPPTDLRLPFQK